MNIVLIYRPNRCSHTTTITVLAYCIHLLLLFQFPFVKAIYYYYEAKISM